MARQSSLVGLFTTGVMLVVGGVLLGDGFLKSGLVFLALGLYRGRAWMSSRPT